MLTFDLQKRNKVTSKKEQDVGHFGLIFVEDKLHKICPLSGDHYIYDKAKQFQKITTFKSLNKVRSHCFLYLQSQKSILLFGGHKLGNGNQNSIYGFSCIDSKWKELKIKMPMK
eukprot:17555_1